MLFNWTRRDNEDFLKNLRILSCLVQLKHVLFNHLCVFENSYSPYVHLHALTSVYMLSQALVAIPLVQYVKTQHTLGQTLKMECGSPNGLGIEVDHMQFVT